MDSFMSILGLIIAILAIGIIWCPEETGKTIGKVVAGYYSEVNK